MGGKFILAGSPKIPASSDHKTMPGFAHKGGPKTDLLLCLLDYTWKISLK